MVCTAAALIGIWQEGLFTMPEPPDYDAIERKEWIENARVVPDRLETCEPNLLKRIQTFVWRFGFSDSSIHKKIKDDEMFAAHFAKEPRRTGLHERVAAEWLRQWTSVSEFKILPKSGAKAFYITSDGEIRKGMKNAPSKSLDFYWETGNIKIFAAHKYTKEGGGNQDSQYNEMRQLLRNFQNARDRDKILIVIVDGPYYTDSKMSELFNSTRSHPPQSYACHIEDVPEILVDF